ncbi:hypothetical protein HDU97_009113 [Phlyctochytrium planicorne]|nr:hypothetical protein HDU97_009113 [Phlyctochytrium planicorne]
MQEDPAGDHHVRPEDASSRSIISDHMQHQQHHQHQPHQQHHQPSPSNFFFAGNAGSTPQPIHNVGTVNSAGSVLNDDFPSPAASIHVPVAGVAPTYNSVVKIVPDDSLQWMSMLESMRNEVRQANISPMDSFLMNAEVSSSSSSNHVGRSNSMNSANVAVGASQASQFYANSGSSNSFQFSPEGSPVFSDASRRPSFAPSSYSIRPGSSTPPSLALSTPIFNTPSPQIPQHQPTFSQITTHNAMFGAYPQHISQDPSQYPLQPIQHIQPNYSQIHTQQQHYTLQRGGAFPSTNSDRSTSPSLHLALPGSLSTTPTSSKASASSKKSKSKATTKSSNAAQASASTSSTAAPVASNSPVIDKANLPKRATVKSGLVIGRPRGRPRKRAPSVSAPIGFVNVLFDLPSRKGETPVHREVLADKIAGLDGDQDAQE